MNRKHLNYLCRQPISNNLRQKDCERIQHKSFYYDVSFLLRTYMVGSFIQICYHEFIFQPNKKTWKVPMKTFKVLVKH